MTNRKNIILVVLLVLCIVGIVVSAPFGMKVMDQASAFQTEAKTRQGKDMSLFTAMNVLKEQKAKLTDTADAADVTGISPAETAEGTETAEALPEAPAEEAEVTQSVPEQSAAPASGFDALAAKHAKDFASEDVSAFTLRLTVFLALIVIIIVIICLLKKIRYLLLTIGALFMVFPFYWMLTGSLKTLAETTRFPPAFVPENWLNFSNYPEAWNKSTVSFTTYFLNSIVVCVLSVGAVMVTTVLAAYAFSRLKFPGRDILFTLLLSMMMIPFELLVITNQQTIVRLGMKNEITSLVIPFISSIFYTYILRNFFMSVPDSLYHAATVDGCGNWGYLWKVMFPIAKPSLVTILLLNAMASWNSFMWPQLVISQPSMRTLPFALTCFTTEAGNENNLLMAAATLVVLPMLIMFLFARKQIVSGVSRGGIKG